MKEKVISSFTNSLESVIEKLGNSGLMKKDMASYINNVIENIQECYKSAGKEIENIQKFRKIVYNVNVSSRDILKENTKSYMWKNSYPMWKIFRKRDSFESIKDKIEKDISLNKKFLIFFDFKLNYIKMSKLIINNFYNKVEYNEENKKEKRITGFFIESIGALEKKMEEIKDKKENLIELEKNFYEKVYGPIRI